ncbi:hypothetical protein G8C93_02895 [Cellulosimicrobium cellulans]|uniref:hypothetical protein n=1 Tax=Cellulosimicrobium cellulans TaxID=1710 RepID=UPI00188321A6|nr:hypothetical protein [Cellulosimicrobium cellulans]MBE9924839.1 hypothetical protein [Cellulosimicrobium cellulans]
MADPKATEDRDSWRQAWRPSVAIPLLVMLTGVVVAVATWVPRADEPTGPSSTAPAASSASQADEVLSCWAYTGDAPSPEQPWNAEDFSEVDCVKPHQFESVPRSDDTRCDDAVYEVLGLSEIRSWGRTVTADLGPTGCAVGRTAESELQTDTYRITAADSVVAAFGACIKPEDVEQYLDGSAFAQSLGGPCYTGRVLTHNVGVGEGQTPEEACSLDVPNRGVQVSTYEEPALPSGLVARCAYTLLGVGGE